MPAALHLPQGKFFFGYTYVPFDPSKVVKKPVDILPTQPFGGQGTSLKSQQTTGTSSSAQQSADATPAAPSDPWAKLGSGNTLSTGGSRKKEKEEQKVSKTQEQQRQEVIDATMLDEDDFWDDDGMDEDDDIIEIDSD